MKSNLLAISMVGALVIPVANADEARGVVETPIAVEEPFGGTLSTGFMSNYVYYGFAADPNAPWAGVTYTIDQGSLPVDVGVWYINPTQSDYNELDVFATVSQEIAGFDTSLTFTGYFYPSFFVPNYELTLNIGRSLGAVDWAAYGLYDFVYRAWIFETSLSKGFTISDDIELVLSSGIGYQVNYWDFGADFNHAFVLVTLPIALRGNVTLEPYIGGLFAMKATESIQGDTIHGGVSISVSF